MDPLPIDDVVDSIVSAVAATGSVVVHAPAGAGKTTRVPRAMLDAGLAQGREVWVLQPRRLATRLAAQRVADESGTKLGDAVGYRIRFENVGRPSTRLRFVTEGVLSRTLATDPDLASIGVVVLDEFHERHIHGDLALALCRRLQRGSRPDLRIAVMSATLDVASVAAFLGDCPVIRATGRRYEVAIEHLPRPDRRPLELQVASALRRLVDEQLAGDVLVFLPGVAEIRRAQGACQPLAREADLDLVPLHGNLPPREQDRALASADRRKVILSTNVAETSVTIQGVVAVVDSGLARSAGHASWSGLSTLRTVPISKASATQRAGRAGRTGPGRCLRLYTKLDFDQRPDHDAPEIDRVDLAETMLSLRAHGIRSPGDLGWLDPPPEPALRAAEELLCRLGAVTDDGSLSATGRRMVGLPTHPRIARVLLEAEQRGVVPLACLVAALLGERDILLRGRPSLNGRSRPVDVAALDPDIASRIERFQQAARADFAPEILRAIGVRRGAARMVDRARQQLMRLMGRARPAAQAEWTGHEQALGLCVLAGFPDRVAKRIRDTELALVGGKAAQVARSDSLQGVEFLVALDATERHDGRGRRIMVKTVCPIEPDWLLELYPDDVEATSELLWSEQRQRVEEVERLQYGTLTLEESRGVSRASDAASELLAEHADALGPEAFAGAEELTCFLARLQLVRDTLPEAELPNLDRSAARRRLGTLCTGRVSFAELREAGLLDTLRAELDHHQLRMLAEQAPERISLPCGRSIAIRYEPGKPPWIASRLQDFFGMQSGPRLARGRVSVVLHLLAPNGRPVQITRDLASFWRETYPAIRGQLRGRYPKHDWPEDGANASPPRPGRLRGR